MVTAIGCSGEEVDDWDYDDMTTEVEVEIEEVPEDPNALEVSYEAIFDTPEGPEVVSGSAIVVP